MSFIRYCLRILLIISLVTVPTSPLPAQVISEPLALPDVSLHGGVNHFRSSRGRDAQTLSDMLRRIQDGFDGVKASVAEIQSALAPGTGLDPVASIGDVVITSVLKTYTTLDDNNSVLVRIQVNFNSPSPTGDWDRVHVYLEKPEVSDVTPLDPTGGPIFAMGEYTGLVSGANILYTYELPPIRQEGWRIYLVSGTPSAVKPLGVTTSLVPSPSSLLTVDPVPEGSAGEEWTSVTTGLSALVEYAVDMVGAVVFRIYGTFTPPTDTSYRGVRMVGREENETDWRTLSVEPMGATTFTSTWMPVPEAAETWDVCAQPKGGTTRFNSIVIGTTDCDQVLIEDQAGLGGLDLTRLDTTTFNTDEFEVSGGAFQMNEINANKIVTGTLKVGGGASDKPGQMGVFDATDTLIGWIGEQGIYYGAWFKQLWVGGSDPTTAHLYTDSSGNLTIDYDLNNITTTLSNFTSGTESIGLEVQNTGSSYNYARLGVDIAGANQPFLELRLDADTYTRSNGYQLFQSNATNTVTLNPDNFIITDGGSNSFRVLPTFPAVVDIYRSIGNIGVSLGGVNGDGNFDGDLSANDINISGTYSMDGGVIVDASKNASFVNIDASGNVDVTGVYEMDGATIINASKHGLFNELYINAGQVIDFSKNASFNDITATGVYKMDSSTLVDASRNATFNALAIDAVASINSAGTAAFVDIGWSGSLSGAVGTGNFYIRAITGAPDCSAGGGVADGWIAIDTTNHRLYVCDGGSNYYIALGT
jgi:hypothetical protein